VLGLLSAATVGRSTEVQAAPDDVRQGLQLWIAAHDAAICSLWAEVNTRVLPDLFGQVERFRGTLGLLDEQALAVLAWRDEHLHQGELCVWAAPGARATAERLVQHVQSWAEHGRPLDAALTIRAFARDAVPPIGPRETVISQRWTVFVLSWA
jgi:hypothetical protein